MLTTLSQKRDERTENILHSTTTLSSSDNKHLPDKDHQITDTFCSIDDDNALRQMENFKLYEFHFIYQVVNEHIQKRFATH